MTHQELVVLLEQVRFRDYQWQIHGDFLPNGKTTYLQASFLAPCAITGRLAVQKTRKWLLSSHMTRSEVVQTVFKCVLTGVEHEAREDFIYKGQPIFGAHFCVDSLVGLCAEGSKDIR